MNSLSIFQVLLVAFVCFLSLVSGHASEGFTLGIRDSIMIAHSFAGEEFGPAQSLHGATYTVDVELSAHDLVEKVNWVIDIGEFSTMISDVLCTYNFKNLNDLFPNENTTTEFMCRRIHNDLASKLGVKTVKGGLSVKLHESHKAWAAYTKNLD
jgi:6-pyruvoyl-tetrahydropterin synthase